MTEQVIRRTGDTTEHRLVSAIGQVHPIDEQHMKVHVRVPRKRHADAYR